MSRFRSRDKTDTGKQKSNQNYVSWSGYKTAKNIMAKLQNGDYYKNGESYKKRRIASCVYKVNMLALLSFDVGHPVILMLIGIFPNHF